jgi:Fe-S cluster assembly scaffold protein SufB
MRLKLIVLLTWKWRGQLDSKIDNQTFITYLSHGEHYLEVEPHASSTYFVTLNSDSDTRETTLHVNAGNHASCTIIMLMHGISHKITCNVQLGESAHLDIKGAVLVSGNNKVECITRQHHTQAHARSSVLIKTMLYDATTFNYHGTIVVDEKAQNTSAAQYNKNLMLSSRARATSTPSLEVIADSVSCKHGTATASLNKDHLAYLQSRGINPEQASHLLIEAFFAEINNVIPHGAVRNEWLSVFACPGFPTWQATSDKRYWHAISKKTISVSQKN